MIGGYVFYKWDIYAYYLLFWDCLIIIVTSDMLIKFLGVLYWDYYVISTLSEIRPLPYFIASGLQIFCPTKSTDDGSVAVSETLI